MPSALDRLVLTFMQIPMTEDQRMELHKLVKEVEEEQAEVIAAIRGFANLCDGDLQNVGGGTSLGFDGRLTAGMIKDAKAIVSRFPALRPH